MNTTKITNQTAYDIIYDLIKSFTFKVTCDGSLLDKEGSLSFIGTILGKDKAERLNALVLYRPNNRYWKILAPLLETMFEDPNYMYLLEELHDSIPSEDANAVIGSPYWVDYHNEIHGCEIALLCELNSFSRNPLFQIEIKPVQ